ncbi:1-phosphatidylinositol 4,5-bisphosphate phosphodiesterase delta-4-like isoform X2 [Dysidea avara]
MNKAGDQFSSLQWDDFICFYYLLCGIKEIHSTRDAHCPVLRVFMTYAKAYSFLKMMTIEEFREFLIDCQGWLPEKATHEVCEQIIHHYDSHCRAFKILLGNRFLICSRHFSFTGFLSFLRSDDNSIIVKEHKSVYQDMSQPLSHYFINSSHNTYLEGEQYVGLSSTNAYMRALLQGCRYLELDCWDGPNGEPKVTHGNTLVSDLSLEEVAKIIDKYAFQTSLYPLILSLENHCCEAQQVRMVKIFHTIFGDKLVEENSFKEKSINQLPSPLELQRKIILTGSLASKHKKQAQRPEQPDSNKIILFCDVDWDKQQKATTIYDMISFGELKALHACEEQSKELLACTERQLVRTYPAGSRIDSSNYDPIPMWNAGIHMVALNIQTLDLPMFLHQGKFRQNGGCGYILKPEVMRNQHDSGYTPNMMRPHDSVAPVKLEIALLSGQHLIILNKKTTSMEIHYETYGIPHDCEKKSYNITSKETNPLWPQFGDTPQLEKTILLPELCLLLFAVYITVHRKPRLLGQNVFALTSLQPGLRFIPLRTASGQSASHIGLFVKIGLKTLK